MTRDLGRRAWVPAAAGLAIGLGAVLVATGLLVTGDGDDRRTQLAAGVGGLAAMAVAAGLLTTSRRLEPVDPAEEPRHPTGYHGYPCACADPGRRRLLRRGALAGGALVAVGALVPLWGLTERAERRLRRTVWAGGRRLVDDRGQPVHRGDMAPGSFMTVWPEGAAHDGDAQAVLIRLLGGREVTGPGRTAWTVDGHVAYSKLCTHMGCPVGLYQSRSDVLVCPCHQATFDVLRGAIPLHGPAERPLPQLPLDVDADGYLVATGDFPEPVGSGFWSRPS